MVKKIVGDSDNILKNTMHCYVVQYLDLQIHKIMQFIYLSMLAVSNSQILCDRPITGCRESIAASWIKVQLKKLWILNKKCQNCILKETQQPENISDQFILTENNITKDYKIRNENSFKKASKIPLTKGGKVQ